jgi:hypothetical protein
VYFATYYGILLLTVLAAYWRGKNSEKLGALIAAIGSIASTGFSHPTIWGDFAIPFFFIDFAVLISFWWLALCSTRFWPYWVTGWQLVGSLVHIQRLMFDDILEKPYGLLSMYIAYPILIVILISSLTTEKRVFRQ